MTFWSSSPPVEPLTVKAERTRILTGVARARVANAWLRLGSTTIVVLVATAIVGGNLPLFWWAGLVAVVCADRVIYGRLLARCVAGDPPQRIVWHVVWTAAQSAYGNLLAVMLWFAPYVAGETLAVLYLCGSLANAAATFRASQIMSLAGAGPTAAFLLALPVADYFVGGGRNVFDLMPLVGGLLLLGFCVNLWRGLRASDAAQIQAEIAAQRERQAAAAAAAAKSDTIRRMNDELRTPMTALVGAAEHLRRAAVSPEARAHIATLVQAGEVLKLVLDDLSDLDRLENGEVRIEPKRADPRELVKSVVAAFRPAAQDKHLELFLDISRQAPALVEMDALRVRQVLFNLLANAVRYTTHGGVRVSLSARPQEDGRVRLTFIVADTGAGMSRSKLAMIFARECYAADGEGPGLGLAISLRLAKLMGGQLNARSDLGQGSVFTFSLDAPIARSRDNSAAA